MRQHRVGETLPREMIDSEVRNNEVADNTGITVQKVLSETSRKEDGSKLSDES